MEIKFKVDASAFNAALSVVKIVTPQALPQGGGGYLFVVQGDTCRVFSKNSSHDVRASFKVMDVEGEGAFMYPAEHVSAFEFIQGLITFTASSEGDSYKVKYTHGGSGVSERVSFDPRSVTPFEKEFEAARAAHPNPKEFNIKILQAGFGMAKSFMAKPNDSTSDDANKTIKIFGDNEDAKLAKANGFLFASNSKEACYFHSTAFLGLVGQDMSVPAAHLPLIESFLAKSSGTIKVYPSDKKTYLVNDRDEVFGWPKHEAEYKEFRYLAKTDEVFVHVSAKSMLYQLQYMRAELSKAKTKIRLHFNPEAKTFWFSSIDDGNTAKSLPIEARDAESKVTSELVANVNVDHMIHLFEGVKGDTAEFRIKIAPAAEGKRAKDYYFFRTIDEFLLSEDGTVAGGSGVENVPEGVHVCKVTRFAPGID